MKHVQEIDGVRVDVKGFHRVEGEWFHQPCGNYWDGTTVEGPTFQMAICSLCEGTETDGQKATRLAKLNRAISRRQREFLNKSSYKTVLPRGI